MRSVLITGASAGFGLLTAVELARRGWRVIATMRNLERKGPLEAALGKAAVAQNVEIIQLDVTDEASIAQAVARMLAITDGFLDAVVHNAGVAAGGAFEDIPEGELRRVMDTNFFGVMALTRALLPTFRKQRSGRIVVVSSEAGLLGQPGNSIYVASKFAVEGWAESLAFEVEPFGIDVAMIEPGPYVTDIWQSSPRFSPEGSAYRQWSQYLFRVIDGHVATRGRDPREVADRIGAVLEAERPNFRNAVGRQARILHFARGKFPTRLLRRGVKAYLGLGRVQM